MRNNIELSSLRASLRFWLFQNRYFKLIQEWRRIVGPVVFREQTGDIKDFFQQQVGSELNAQNEVVGPISDYKILLRFLLDPPKSSNPSVQFKWTPRIPKQSKQTLSNLNILDISSGFSALPYFLINWILNNKAVFIPSSDLELESLGANLFEKGFSVFDKIPYPSFIIKLEKPIILPE